MSGYGFLAIVCLWLGAVVAVGLWQSRRNLREIERAVRRRRRRALRRETV
jgi:hypothetical protein